MAQLGLGTVQFGLDYGISNDDGQVTEEAARRILARAYAAGVRYLDTARAYGASEEALGHCIAADQSWNVVTKTPPLAPQEATCEAVREHFEASLAALKVPDVYGLLSHRSELFLEDGGRARWDTYRALKDAGRVQRIGASVYEGTEIDRLLELPDLDLIQLPASILDQRLLRSGHIATLRDAEVEIHVRSVFLQGLMFMTPETLPPRLTQFSGTLRALHETADDAGLSTPELALRFALERLNADVILVGVTNEEQLLRNIHWAASTTELPSDERLEAVASENPELTNPATWNT